MAEQTGPGDTTAATATSPGAAFGNVLSTALDFAVSKMSQKTDDWTDKLNDVAAGEAEKVSAGLKNPVWTAIKGAWSAGGAQVKAAMVAAVVTMVLLLVLSPVLLLVFLLSLLIIAAVAKARSAKQ